MLNLRSAISVPLKLGKRVLGVVTWVAGEQGRRFTTDDVAFGDRLGRLEIGGQEGMRDTTRQFRMIFVDNSNRRIVHFL